MPKDLLTNLKINKANCPASKGVIYLSDGNGLSLRVTKDQNKYWLVRLFRDGKESQRGIGEYPQISLTRAREMRDEYKSLWKEGQDPKILRLKQQFNVIQALNQTFDYVQAETFKHKIQKLSSSHQKRWAGLYKNYIKHKVGDLPLTEIDDSIVLELVEQIYSDKPQTANKVKNLISVVFTFAIERKWFRGINPTILLKGNSLIRKPKNDHFKYLEESRVPELLLALSEHHNVVVSSFVYILMTSALRVGSLRHAKWSWLHDDYIIIPKEYMKSREEFRCPLPRQALEKINNLRKITGGRNNAYIFPSMSSKSPISDNTCRQFLQKSLKDKYTLHGFRTLFNRVVTKSLKFQIEIIESQLTHAYTQTAIRRIYLGNEDYLNERKVIVQFYADWLDVQKNVDDLYIDKKIFSSLSN